LGLSTTTTYSPRRAYAQESFAAIAACGGDAHEAVKALIIANHYLETDLEKLKAAASMGYARGQLLPSDSEGLV